MFEKMTKYVNVFPLNFSETKSSCGNQSNHEKEFGQIAESPRKRNQNFKGKTNNLFCSTIMPCQNTWLSPLTPPDIITASPHRKNPGLCSVLRVAIGMENAPKIINHVATLLKRK